MSRLFSTQEHICMCLVMYRLFVLFPKRDLTKNKENLNEDKTAKTFIDQQKEEFHEHEELRTEVMKWGVGHNTICSSQIVMFVYMGKLQCDWMINHVSMDKIRVMSGFGLKKIQPIASLFFMSGWNFGPSPAHALSGWVGQVFSFQTGWIG